MTTQCKKAFHPLVVKLAQAPTHQMWRPTQQKSKQPTRRKRHQHLIAMGRKDGKAIKTGSTDSGRRENQKDSDRIHQQNKGSQLPTMDVSDPLNRT